MNSLFNEKEKAKNKSLIAIVNQAKELLKEVNENDEKLTIEQKYDIMQKLISLDVKILSETENFELEDDFKVVFN